MRLSLAHGRVLSPGFRLVATSADPLVLARDLHFPCVVKPVHLSGSRGVIRANGPEEFAIAFRRVAALLRKPEVAHGAGEWAQRILVEDFIPGREVALEGLFVQGRLRVLAIFDKPDPLDGPFFEESITSLLRISPSGSRTTSPSAPSTRHGPSGSSRAPSTPSCA